MKERNFAAIGKKEQQFSAMIRKSFDIAVKDRSKSEIILQKAAQLKDEIKLLKRQRN